MNNDRVQSAERLADLLTQENEALQRLDFAAAVALLPAKEAVILELTKQPRMAVVPISVAAMHRRLIGLAKENQVLLERAIAVQTRVVRILARACTTRPVVARYGTHATPAPSNRAVAMALSTRA